MTDNSRYRTDLDEMQKLIDRAAEIEKAIEDHLGQIQKRVAAMHLHWSGAAATAHDDAHQQWLTAVRAMHTALGDMRGETSKAHRIYSEVVDHHRRRMWPPA